MSETSSKIRNVDLMRSYLPAPKLNEMIGCEPWVNPWSGSMENCMTEARIAMAPTAVSPPYLSSDELKQTLSKLSVICMTNGDRPSMRHGAMTAIDSLKNRLRMFR